MQIPDVEQQVEKQQPLVRISPKQATRELAVVAGSVLVGTLVLFGFQYFSLNIVLPVGLLLMAVLAYWNGANDISKAIATLVGSGLSKKQRSCQYGRKQSFFARI